MNIIISLLIFYILKRFKVGVLNIKKPISYTTIIIISILAYMTLRLIDYAFYHWGMASVQILIFVVWYQCIFTRMQNLEYEEKSIWNLLMNLFGFWGIGYLLLMIPVIQNQPHVASAIVLLINNYYLRIIYFHHNYFKTKKKISLFML